MAMKDGEKSRVQLIYELEELRQRNIELESKKPVNKTESLEELSKSEDIIKRVFEEIEVP